MPLVPEEHFVAVVTQNPVENGGACTGDAGEGHGVDGGVAWNLEVKKECRKRHSFYRFSEMRISISSNTKSESGFVFSKRKRVKISKAW